MGNSMFIKSHKPFDRKSACVFQYCPHAGWANKKKKNLHPFLNKMSCLPKTKHIVFEPSLKITLVLRLRTQCAVQRISDDLGLERVSLFCTITETIKLKRVIGLNLYNQ